MKDYNMIKCPDGTYRVVEETTLFDGLSEQEAREAVEQFKVAQRRLEQHYKRVGEATDMTAGILAGIA